MGGSSYRAVGECFRRHLGLLDHLQDGGPRRNVLFLGIRRAIRQLPQLHGLE